MCPSSPARKHCNDPVVFRCSPPCARRLCPFAPAAPVSLHHGPTRRAVAAGAGPDQPRACSGERFDRGHRHGHQPVGHRHGGHHRQPARQHRAGPAKHRAQRRRADAAPRRHAGRDAQRPGGRDVQRFRPAGQSASDPGARRRPHPPARQRRRVGRRVQPELRPRGGARSAGDRAHRGAARPGRAAVRRQRHRWRGQHIGQPHPARGAAKPGRTSRVAVGRRRPRAGRGRAVGGRCQRLELAPRRRPPQEREPAHAALHADRRWPAAGRHPGDRQQRRREPVGRCGRLLGRCPRPPRRGAGHLPKRLRRHRRTRRHHPHEARPVAAGR